MTFVRSLIFTTTCLAGTLSVASAQVIVDLSAPAIALETRADQGIVEGAPLPRGIQDNTVQAAPFVMEKCLEFINGGPTLEESFRGTRFVPVENPLATLIPGTSKVAYGHPDLHETFVFDQSSGSLRGCGIVMASDQAIKGFDAARDFGRDTYNMGAVLSESAIFNSDTQLTELTPEDQGLAAFKIENGPAVSHVVTQINHKTGFIMSIFLSEAEG